MRGQARSEGEQAGEQGARGAGWGQGGARGARCMLYWVLGSPSLLWGQGVRGSEGSEAYVISGFYGPYHLCGARGEGQRGARGTRCMLY